MMNINKNAGKKEENKLFNLVLYYTSVLFWYSICEKKWVKKVMVKMLARLTYLKNSFLWCWLQVCNIRLVLYTKVLTLGAKAKFNPPITCEIQGNNYIEFDCVLYEVDLQVATSFLC